MTKILSLDSGNGGARIRVRDMIFTEGFTKKAGVFYLVAVGPEQEIRAAAQTLAKAPAGTLSSLDGDREHYWPCVSLAEGTRMSYTRVSPHLRGLLVTPPEEILIAPDETDAQELLWLQLKDEAIAHRSWVESLWPMMEVVPTVVGNMRAWKRPSSPAQMVAEGLTKGRVSLPAPSLVINTATEGEQDIASVNLEEDRHVA